MRMKPKYEDDLMIEPTLQLYRINNQGKMRCQTEIPVKMGRKFQASTEGNMMLTRSMDAKVISLCNFDRNSSYGDYFKILAWHRELTETHAVSEDLNLGINAYYAREKAYFDKLESVTFVNGQKHLELVYMEKKQRSKEEKYAYELDIIEKRKKCKHKEKQYMQDTYTMREEPRMARKYVYFDVETGYVAFEYGGVRPCHEKEKRKVRNMDGELVEAFELGILIKERQLGSRGGVVDTMFQFYVAGDFFSKELSEKKIKFQWALCHFEISMEELLNEYSNQSSSTKEEKARSMEEQKESRIGE